MKKSEKNEISRTIELIYHELEQCANDRKTAETIMQLEFQIVRLSDRISALEEKLNSSASIAVVR